MAIIPSIAYFSSKLGELYPTIKRNETAADKGL